MDEKMRIVFALAVAVVFLAGCMSPSSKVIAVGDGAADQANAEIGVSEPEIDVSAAVNISAKSPLEIEIERRLEAAENAKGRRSSLPEIFYQNVPPFPEDFYKLRILVIYGKITNLDLVGEEYWKQPEFIPGFEEHAVKLINNPQEGRWGAFGYGAYPSDTEVTTSPGQEFNLTTFFHTSWLVETYQGMKLVLDYRENSTIPTQDLQGSNTITQDPAKVREYFDVRISPDVLVLEPSYPILEKGWIQKVKMFVKVKENTPPGRYVIGVGINSPPDDFNDEMMMKYLNLYTTGGSNVGVGRPFYEVVVNVK